METIVYSSCGEITIHKETGVKIRAKIDCDCNAGDRCIKRISKFDVEEYKKHYNKTDVPDRVDILDMGYWQWQEKSHSLKKVYEEPAHEWRKDAVKLRNGTYYK